MRWRRSFSRKHPLDAQLEDELRFHLEELTAENIAAGMMSEEARREALLEFGGPQQIREEVREVWRLRAIETAVSHLKSAVRFLRKSPAFSAAVILTLALGIGANSAVFSAIDAILLRPLPFPGGDRLMRVYQYTPKVAAPPTFVAPMRLEDWNRMNSTFQAITGYYTEDISETGGALPEKVTMAFIAPRFLQVWGVAPALGRDFSREEERSGGPVLISDRFWRHRFGADPNVIGKRVRIGSGSSTIVGVMPASFLFPNHDVDIWSPVPDHGPYIENRESTWYNTVGRLKPGVTPEQARANLQTVQRQLGVQYPKTDAALAVGIEPLKKTTIGETGGSLKILFGSVSLLLLIACLNIVALLLARGIQRQHEISIRYSLGASRMVIVTQLLTETFVLALAGASAGLAIAAASSRVFQMLAKSLPRVEEIHLNGRIVLYTLTCSVIATLLCGLFPALRATRRSIAGSPAQTGHTQVSARHRLQWLLVGAQVALAVTLLSGAGLLVRSFQALGRVSPGFEPAHVLAFHVSASWAETTDMKGLTQKIDNMTDALRAIPGVEAAATSATLPGVPGQYQTELKFSAGPADPNRKIIAETRFVSPDYFGAMRILLLNGSLCRAELGNTQVMVNRSFAGIYLTEATATGRRIETIGNSFPLAGEIKGVVADARESGLNREPGPTIYFCISAPVPDPYYLVRTAGGITAMSDEIRRKIHEIEPTRSVFAVTPLEAHLSEAFSENRLRTVLLSFFAVTALSLACIGLYGTLSYSVTRRQREVGLRLALGAMRGRILQQFFGQGMIVTLAGCAAGWGLATAFSRLLSEMLYGVSPTDFITLTGVALLMLVVAAFASLIPAMRAARVDPMRVLRED